MRTAPPSGGQYRWIDVAPASADTVIAASRPASRPQTDDVDGFHAQLKGGR